MSPEDKQNEYRSFIDNKSTVLITTDMLARGIDIITIALVINYDIPIEKIDD